MSAVTAGEPGRRAGATVRQWSLAAPPAQEAGRPVSIQQAGRAVPGRRVPAAAPRHRTGSAAPGRRVVAVAGQRSRTMAPGQRAATTPGLRLETVAGHLAVVAPRQRAATVARPRGTATPGQWDATAGRRSRLGAARPRPPALTVVLPRSAAEEEWPAVPAPVRKPEMGMDERERRAPQRPAQALRGRARPRTRLTRRGRIVVSALVMAAMLLVAVLAWFGGATRAEAAGSGSPPSAVYRNLAKVIVQPGESLWAIAAQAEPTADPRSVIQQIIDLNALGGASIQPGERLWVPRG
jgi:hypothetical protein